MEPVTKENLQARAANYNARIAASGRHIEVQGRNGGFSIDEYRGTECLRHIRAGTKREMYEFLHAMMVGYDLPRIA